VQTTAIALLAIGLDDADLSERGGAVLERTWRRESEGTLTLATSLCALRLIGSRDARAAEAQLRARAADAAEDAITTSWIAFAMGAPAPWEIP
jgi:hypothetical protein